MRNDKMIFIEQCSDPMMWYKNETGSFFNLIKEYDDCYLTRDLGGFTNIVKKEDARLLTIEELLQENKFNDQEQEIVDLIQEECAELIQSISKVRRFGRKDNIEKVCTEMADLKCLIGLAEKHIAEVGLFDFAEAEKVKIEKLRKYSRIFSG